MFLGVCQKCRASLKVNCNKPVQESSLLSFNTAYPGDEDDEQRKFENDAIKLLGESFVVLADDAGDGGRPLASPRALQSTDLDRKITALTNIFEVASDKCQFDHPMCTECTQSIFNELDRRLKEHQSDREAYEICLQRLRLTPPPPMPPPADEDEEALLLAQIQELRSEREALAGEKAALETETKQVEEFERRFWEEYQAFQLGMGQINKEYSAVKQEVAVATSRLERLKRTNVFDDAFHISYDGHFGTINSFRLGRLPSQPIDWSETNAALGQVLLLLHTIAKRSNFTFSKYLLVPFGSSSRIVKRDDPKTAYELYGSNDLSLGRLFWYRRFDTALVWLLECITEFGDFAASQDPRFKQQYPVQGELIGNVSIKLQFNNGPKWTKATKYMLTNLKYLLAWSSKRMC